MKNEIIYQIFVRNYSKDGTFKAVENDLPRIKDLGTTIVYLMPIHEIGIKNRKGTYGSPYAIKDYFSISRDLGTLADFHSLVDKTHKLGMKIIIDMVFNHTSPDNVLLKDHEDYYYHKSDGNRGNRIGDWTDIIDLDTYKDEVQDYLVSVLQYWINQGVDGFRFDVASIIPLSFFVRARKVLGNKPIFFAESIDDGFVGYAKSLGINVIPDKDLYPTFDCLYNYSWYRPLENHLKYDNSLDEMINQINEDNKRLNKNFLRANCLENHDCDRIAGLEKDRNILKEYIKLSCILKGHIFIYAGGEYGISKKPELFEKDPVPWDKKDTEIYSLYKSLIKDKMNQKEIIKQVLSLEDNNIVVKQEYIDKTKQEYKFKAK